MPKINANKTEIIEVEIDSNALAKTLAENWPGAEIGFFISELMDRLAFNDKEPEVIDYLHRCGYTRRLKEWSEGKEQHSG